MTWTPRVLEPSEVDAYIDLSSLMFGAGPKASEDYRKVVGPATEVERTFVIEDGGQMVGTAGAFSLSVALPGATSLPMSGVTEVGVRPTHRRQGMLRVLMDAVIDQAIERGEPLAGLTASEGGIYRRFGYGVAARFHSVTVDRARAQEVVDLRAPGQLRLVDEAEAGKLMPAIWDEVWPRRVGEITRPPGFWTGWAVDPESDRDGASARYIVVHEDEAGTADGYAIYRMKHGKAIGGRWFELRVDDLAGLDDKVEATLLRYLLDVDLVHTLSWNAAPTDLSLRWRLSDSRAVDVTRERDHLWLRPLDVTRCLSSRVYATDGGAVLDVVDEARPDLGGRFSLSGGPDGTDCARTDAEADVVLRTPELGALLLGGVSWETLRRSGLVDEQTDGAVDRLDAMFRPSRAPYCSTGF